MKSKLLSFSLIASAALMASSCTTLPGGIAPSTTPINGREYSNFGKVKGTDSKVCLLGFLPISGSNTTQSAIDDAIEEKEADALINVTVDFYSQFWILFSRSVTEVNGEAIRFVKPAPAPETTPAVNQAPKVTPIVETESSDIAAPEPTSNPVTLSK